jgi:hypothetical protein
MYVCNVRFPTAALMDRTTIAELSGADSHRHDFCRFLPCAMDAAGCGKLKYLTRGSYFLAGNLALLGLPPKNNCHVYNRVESSWPRERVGKKCLELLLCTPTDHDELLRPAAIGNVVVNLEFARNDH